MTESNDADIFGNKVKYTGEGRTGVELYSNYDSHDLYENERYDPDHPAGNQHARTHNADGYGADGYDPFAQSRPASGEPLFPAAPMPTSTPHTESSWTNGVAEHREEHPADDAWIEATPKSVVYDYGDPGQSYDSPDVPTVDDGALDRPQTWGADDNVPATELTPAAEPFVPAARNEVPVAGDATARHMPLVEPLPVAALHKSPAPHPVSEREALFNRHFAQLSQLMQHGAWPQAVEKLQTMRAEFPEAAVLENLLDEAMLKAELMTTWSHKIKGRRLTVGQEWLIRRSLPFMVLVILFVCGVIFYQSFVAPSRQVVAMERANQALIEEAAGLLKVGQIDEAIVLFNEVLARNPDNVTAQQGLTDASKLVGLATTYDLAIRVANQGNLTRSLRMLESIKATSPSFRDIDRRIARVTSLLAAEAEYLLAEKAFAQHRWLDAIAHYEATLRAADDYQVVRVGLQLRVAYAMAAQQMMHEWPSGQFSSVQIRDFLRKSLELNGPDETVSRFLANLDEFMRGERELGNNNLAMAVRAWQPLYAAQPDFLGGYLAEQLYRAYLALAAEVRANDPEYARELYTLAAALPVQDSSEAQSQLQQLGAATPPVQPTSTPLPTVAYIAPVAAPVAVAEPPTPEPTATPANSYLGWIAFRSTRNGSEQVFVMRADGSEVQLAPEEIYGRIDTLYQAERRAPDGQTVYVQSATGRSDANIYIASSDGMSQREVTTYNGDEYDPAWAPQGDRIAFVANHTGNDEIWVMAADGSGQQQLTFNNWEWDKHPTWSPDGSQLAFFSNRTGQRQIWVMSADGSNQRNLSNNGFDDWDPVWIK